MEVELCIYVSCASDWLKWENFNNECKKTLKIISAVRESREAGRL